MAEGQDAPARHPLTLVGNGSDFTGRTAVTPRVPSHPHPVPIIAPSGSRLTRRESRSPAISRPISSDPTLGWPTAPQPRSPQPGDPIPMSYKPQRPEPSTPEGPGQRHPIRGGPHRRLDPWPARFRPVGEHTPIRGKARCTGRPHPPGPARCMRPGSRASVPLTFLWLSLRSGLYYYSNYSSVTAAPQLRWSFE